jgi:lysophospholipase L1-like esterase
VITVWVDSNINGLIDPGEPQVRAAVTWTRAQSTTWLALGDSYSAGVGIPGTPDDPDNPNCRQHADLSYAGQARAAEASEHTIAFKFAACMGAVTADITDRPQPNTTQFAQIDYVKANTPDVVTLTIGGNDIGFPSIASHCVINSIVPWLVSCPVDSNAMRLADPQKGERPSWDGLYDRLVKTYVAIRKAQPAGGQLYVLSYPVPFDNPLHWRLGSLLLNNCDGFSIKEARLANAMSVRLGDTIFLAVQEANRQVGGVHFVDWRPPVTTEWINGRMQRVAYDPNGLCSRNGPSSADMNGLYFPIAPPGLGKDDSFHPTQRGYSNGASSLVDALNKYTWG